MVKFTAAAASLGAALLAGLSSAVPTASVRESGSHGVLSARQESSFWYANMDHTGNARGFAPDLDGDYTYEVYKALSPGATAADFQSAIDSGTNGTERHALWLASQPRVVYVPPGTYELSETIYMRTDTILMGDATDPPVIKAAAGFNGQNLLYGRDQRTVDESTGEERGELSFAVGVKNIILDTTNIAAGNEFTALFWGVAQVAQLQNIVIRMPSSSNGSGHTGILLQRGSTLGLADVRIEKGQNGINHDGHQQALYKNIYFYQNTVGMLITGGSTVSIFSPTFDTVGTAVLNTGGSPWIGLVDATSINSGVTLRTTSYPSFLIENLNKDTDSDIAIVSDRGTILSGQSHVDTFTYGNTVGRDPAYGETTTNNVRPEALAPGGKYPVIPAPNYADTTTADFINIKDPAQNGGHEILGDNTVDESAALNAILQLAAESGKIAYFPFGKYRVDDTLFVPVGSRIVGEAWATITGNGDRFADAANPAPVVQVGEPGDEGVAQISDMRFTVSDVLPGAIIMQWHMAGASPGDVALWNSIITVGGTRGASALTDSCRSASDECQGAFIGLHLAPTSSVYVENVWNWVADHVTEDFDGGSSIAAKGGTLVESTRATWLHALGSEHYWLYQLNLRQARNVVVSLLQSETNYEQGDNVLQAPPAPWTPDVEGWGDPDFAWCGQDDTRCRMGFSNWINGGENIYTYASASWTFFSGPGYQACPEGYSCQNYIHWIEQQPTNLQAFGLCSKNTWAGLRLADGTAVLTDPDFTGSWTPYGGDVGRYTP